MSHIYGHKWTSTYGVSPLDEQFNLTATAVTWATGLRDITGEQIAKALHCCIDRDDPWPPDLPEFKRLCTGKGVNEFGLDYIPEYHRSVKIVKKDRLLSSDERDRRRAEGMAHLREIKNSLQRKCRQR